ncbi:hypothetical protein LPJ59_002348 [Coemansia sp. RSA 2399]|nr:hypothetical protein LPJ59_002348 [Coemansia sp. RSA 2399]
MNKYLEVCSEPRIISQDGENMTIAENPPPHSTDMAATQPAQVLRRGSSISRRGSVYEEPREPDGVDLLDTADSGPAKAEPPHSSSTAESGRNIIKSEPTDADAPTPPPTNSPPGLASLEQNAITPQAPVDSAASDSKPAPQAADDDSSTQNKDQIAPNVPEGTTETSPDVAQRTSSPAAEQASIPPPKKQRLSLQEYNKRRRVNNPTVSSKEAESKDASVVNTPEAASAPAASEEPALQTADHSMATNDGSVLTAPVPVRPASTVYTEAGAPSRGESTTPPLPPALLASAEGIMPKGSDNMSSQQRHSRSPKLADSPAARALSSSLPPSMTMAEAVSGGGSSSAGRGDERPRSSTGYSNGPRIERSSTGAAYDAGGAYRPRERDYGHHDAPGSVERESGEIAHRRERMRSSSRGRGERDRERRHNTFGGTSSGQYYNQPPPPPPPRSLTPHNIEGARGSQRGLGDWRPGSGYSSQRMSPSPSFYGSGPTPSSSHSQHQSQQGGGSSGAGAMSRRTGIGTEGSRGGSPLRK